MRLACRSARWLCTTLLTLAIAGSGTAFAAGQRSFVSISGVDNPACSIPAPCRTFSAAITATSAGGEVIALDSGGYGPVAITQSVSIIAAPGAYAGISVLSGHGVTIATAVTDTVVLRGLTINNQGSSGRGIYITGAGIVRIENVRVGGFTGASGLKAAPADVLQLHIRDSVFHHNSTGIALNAGGATETMQIAATLAGIEVANNSDGLIVGNNAAATLSRSIVVNNSGRGVGSNPTLGQTASVNVDECEIAGNNQAVYPGDTPGTTVLQISGSRIVSNVTGIAVGLGSTTRVSGTSIENNAYGINIIPAGGTIESAGNNVLRGNTNFEPVLTTFPLR